jgi:branched-chain amino acid transport system permease protein
VSYFAQQLVNGIALGSVFAVLALGVSLVWGVLDVLNFSHAQFMTWGVFGTAFGISHGLPVVVSIVVGMLTGAALAVIVEEAVITPLKRRAHVDASSIVVATIGVAIVLETVIKKLTHSELRSFTSEGFPSGSIPVAGISIGLLPLAIFLTSVVVMVALALWLARTRLGRELRTVAYSRERAEMVGINPRTSYVIAFVISGALAALAGTFVGAETAVISYSSGDGLLLITFAAVVIGGMGSIPGAVLGGMVLGIGQVLTAAFISQSVSDVLAFGLMVIVLLVRPTGLLRRQAVSRA